MTSLARDSFVATVAPGRRICGCGCGQAIEKDVPCFARAYKTKSRCNRSQQQHTWLVSLDHYDDWFENVAKTYSDKAAKRNPAFARYLGTK